MDAFSIVVGFAGVSPGYFWRRMDWREFVAILEHYKTDWYKTKLIINALGTEFNLPWDDEIKARAAAANKPKYTAAQRLNVAAQLAKMNHFKN